MQHRMRPEIADLVVGTIYDELLNHDSVKLYPDVKGTTKNVYFITHTEKELSVMLNSKLNFTTRIVFSCNLTLINYAVLYL